MSSQTLNLNEQVYKYLLSVSLREHPLLTELRNETAKLPNSNMQISPEQGQFMALMAEILAPTKLLEIGVFTGYSSLALALAMPANGKIYACDVSEEFTKTAKRFWKKAEVDEKIIFHLDPALKTINYLMNSGHENSFDMVFIDADKVNYVHYYEKSLHLLRKGGVILIDNVLWGGSPADESINDEDTVAIRELNEKLKTDSRVSISMVPIGDGLTIARKR